MQPTEDDLKLFEIVWDFLCLKTPLSKADVIIGGGGCRDTGVAAHCAELYHQGLAPNIVFTGYQQANMPKTEAALFSEVAQSLGVPASAIIEEPRASNTGENITFSQKVIEKYGIAPERVILVHKPYMSRRFLATAEAMWQEKQPEFFVSYQTISLQAYLAEQGKTYVFRHALGDFKRMIEYPALGFMSQHPIPPKAKAAYEILLERGYETR